MPAVPPAILDQIDLRTGAPASLAVEHGHLILESRPRSRYALSDLLAQREIEAEVATENRDWTSAGPVGGELLSWRTALASVRAKVLNDVSAKLAADVE